MNIPVEYESLEREFDELYGWWKRLMLNKATADPVTLSNIHARTLNCQQKMLRITSQQVVPASAAAAPADGS